MFQFRIRKFNRILRTIYEQLPALLKEEEDIYELKLKLINQLEKNQQAQKEPSEELWRSLETLYNQHTKLINQTVKKSTQIVRIAEKIGEGKQLFDFPTQGLKKVLPDLVDYKERVTDVYNTLNRRDPKLTIETFTAREAGISKKDVQKWMDKLLDDIDFHGRQFILAVVRAIRPPLAVRVKRFCLATIVQIIFAFGFAGSCNVVQKTFFPSWEEARVKEEQFYNNLHIKRDFSFTMQQITDMLSVNLGDRGFLKTLYGETVVLKFEQWMQKNPKKAKGLQSFQTFYDETVNQH